MKSPMTNQINAFVREAEAEYELNCLTEYAEANGLTLSDVEDRAPSWKFDLINVNRSKWCKVLFTSIIEKFGREAVYRAIRQSESRDPVLIARALVKYVPPEELFSYSKDDVIYDIIKERPSSSINFLDSTVIPYLFGIEYYNRQQINALKEVVVNTKDPLWHLADCDECELDAIYDYLLSSASSKAVQKFNTSTLGSNLINSIVIVKSAMIHLLTLEEQVGVVKNKIDGIIRNVMSRRDDGQVVPNLISANAVKLDMLATHLLRDRSALPQTLPVIAAMLCVKIHDRPLVGIYSQKLGDFLEMFLQDDSVARLTKIEILRDFGFFDAYRECLSRVGK